MEIIITIIVGIVILTNISKYITNLIIESKKEEEKMYRVEVYDHKWLCVRVCEDIEEAVKYYQVRKNINNKERLRIIQVIIDNIE